MFNDLSEDEIAGIERARHRVIERRSKKTAQFSIADSPFCDRSASRPANAKDAAASPLAISAETHLQ